MVHAAARRDVRLPLLPVGVVTLVLRLTRTGKGVLLVGLLGSVQVRIEILFHMTLTTTV